MAINQDHISRKICFKLKSGVTIYPIRVKRRDNGKLAFRVSKGGKGGNTLACGEEVDEESMIRKVRDLGYAVRCASLDGSKRGLYRVAGRAVREMVIEGS